MFWPRHFGARYFTPGYFGDQTDAPPGSIYGSVSGLAIVAATLSAEGWAQAGLLGAASVEATITSATGEIASLITAGASLSASLSAAAETPSNVIYVAWRPLPRREWVRPGSIAARIRARSSIIATLSARMRPDPALVARRNAAFLLLAS